MVALVLILSKLGYLDPNGGTRIILVTFGIIFNISIITEYIKNIFINVL